MSNMRATYLQSSHRNGNCESPYEQSQDLKSQDVKSQGLNSSGLRSKDERSPYQSACVEVKYYFTKTLVGLIVAIVVGAIVGMVIGMVL